MKTKEFSDFKISLNLSIEIDSNLRRITEKIKLLSSLRDIEGLTAVSKFLQETDDSIDSLISIHHCKDVDNVE